MAFGLATVEASALLFGKGSVMLSHVGLFATRASPQIDLVRRLESRVIRFIQIFVRKIGRRSIRAGLNTTRG